MRQAALALAALVALSIATGTAVAQGTSYPIAAHAAAQLTGHGGWGGPGYGGGWGGSGHGGGWGGPGYGPRGYPGYRHGHDGRHWPPPPVYVPPPVYRHPGYYGPQRGFQYYGPRCGFSIGF